MMSIHMDLLEKALGILYQLKLELTQLKKK